MSRTTRRLSQWAALVAAALPFSFASAAVEHLETAKDFDVNLVHTADKEKNGSWISVATDGKGRLLLGGQRNQPLTRITLTPDGKVAKEEVLKLPVTEIMGMLWAYDSLYVNASDGKAFGLFRLTSKDGGDTFDNCEKLRDWKGGAGEHGAHGIVLGKDGKLYVVAGNFVDLPTDALPTSPYRNFGDDLALPRAEDGNGFGAGRKPPGGYVVRLDKDGKNAEIIAAGQRNTYDIAFNADGELFGFDSDMEWDWGTPWYRPTRVFHVVSGGDTGFREGTAKWPEYYADSLPAVVNIGLGSPTGVAFGTGAKFPVKYQKAMYILDWTYGRVMAVHPQPQGAGYTATFENFVAPKGMAVKGGKKSPNNVTDVVIGNDGALYFTTGGRNTQGNLYRVTYTGSESTAGDPKDTSASDARAKRHALEQLHASPNVKAIETAWPHLSSPDRTLRFAARVAIEAQPVAEWKNKALAEKNPQAAAMALLALARNSDKASQGAIIARVRELIAAKPAEAGLLEAIRIAQVSIARHGAPEGDAGKSLAADLAALYGATPSWAVNRELAQVLIALGEPSVVAKSLELAAKTNVQEEQIGYALFLRLAKAGWTQDLRKAYLTWWTTDRKQLTHPAELMTWFADVGRDYSDGSSFNNFLGKLHAEVTKQLSPEETTALAEVIKAYTPPAAKPKPAPAKPRAFVKNWEMADLEPLLASAAKGRNYNRGKEAFVAAQCLACHKFGSDGGAIGPDITAVASRFKTRDLLESIVDPNKVVSEQYQNTDVKTNEGDLFVGRLVEDRADAVVLLADQLKPDQKTVVKKSDIASMKPSKLSPMPAGLINILTKDEILDLLAYVESGGDRNHPAFQK
jgi:putative heme-binding domain-containing protein